MSMTKGWNLADEPVKNIPAMCRRDDDGVPIELWMLDMFLAAELPKDAEKCYVVQYPDGGVTYHAVN